MVNTCFIPSRIRQSSASEFDHTVYLQKLDTSYIEIFFAEREWPRHSAAVRKHANEDVGAPGMPANLREAHERNDETLEHIYIGRRFKNDTERLEKLFELYTQMTSGSADVPVGKSRKPKKSRGNT